MANATASESGTNRFLATPVISNDGTKTATMDKHRQKARRDGPLRSLQHAARRWQVRVASISVLSMFSISTTPSSTRMPTASAKPAERHDVQRLAAQPEAHYGSQQGKRNRGHDDERTSPIAQKEQDDETGQHRSQQPFAHHGQQRALDIGRLIELIADVDVEGTSERKRARLCLTSSTTVSVEASGRLVTGMYTARRPFTSA